jgi:hypothetical protein
MVPKLDQRRGYASKHRILLRHSVAMKQGNKPVAGHVMVQTKGQELSQITHTHRRPIPRQPVRAQRLVPDAWASIVVIL